ncbi:hypothetical protein TeGR_g9258, partial [Tetraparma gracilis]
AEQIFATLACITETLVFLYMGMSVFTGAFSHWNPFTSLLLLGFCVLARACHIFPLTYLCNMCRPAHDQIPRKMTVVLWFVGLRGAIAFALACNMPGPNAKSYIANTLAICIFTTVVCGGVTEKILTRYGMKQPLSADIELTHGSTPYENLVRPESPDRAVSNGWVGGGRPPSDSLSRRLDTHARSAFKQLDERYLKPLFGGKGQPSRRGASPNDSVDVHDVQETHEMIPRGARSDGGSSSGSGGGGGAVLTAGDRKGSIIDAYDGEFGGPEGAGQVALGAGERRGSEEVVFGMYGDANCLTNQVGWNQQMSFFVKTQVKVIDESEGLKPEALEQMKRELKLLQGKVVANIEKELKAASDKGEEERGAAFAEANELIACINADARRLHGDSAKVIGSAEEMMADLLQAMAGVHKGKGEHEKALEKYEEALEMKTKVKAIDESEGLKPEALEQMKRELKLLQGKVVANIEKELKAASDKGEKERGVAFAEANELIARIDADAMRLHGDSAKVIGSAAKLGPGLLVDAAKDGDIKM